MTASLHPSPKRRAIACGQAALTLPRLVRVLAHPTLGTDANGFPAPWFGAVRADAPAIPGLFEIFPAALLPGAGQAAVIEAHAVASAERLPAAALRSPAFLCADVVFHLSMALFPAGENGGIAVRIVDLEAGRHWPVLTRKDVPTGDNAGAGARAAAMIEAGIAPWRLPTLEETFRRVRAAGG